MFPFITTLWIHKNTEGKKNTDLKILYKYFICGLFSVNDPSKS